MSGERGGGGKGLLLAVGWASVLVIAVSTLICGEFPIPFAGWLR